jgi:trimeric autotransporter adhesin
MRLWLGVGVASVAAVVAATGALGGSSAGTITTVAGTGVQGFSGDGGPAIAAKLYSPTGLAVDAQGDIYIADHGGARVRKVTRGGTISTFAGTGGAGFSGDGGLATSARVGTPYGVAVDGNGNVYISDRYNNRVRKVSPGGTITTFAGTGAYGTGSFGDGGPATSAQLRNPYGIAVDGKGNLYIADHDHSKVRKVDAGGTITTFAGTGVRGFSGDGGRATAAKLISPYGLAVDGKGNVYIADRGDHRVRKVSPGGTITTFAGTGESANDGDGDGGPATSARIQQPQALAVDGNGNVYIAAGGSVRMVNPRGTITTFAGGGRAYPGDGGPATSVALRAPSAIALDRTGTVYIAEGWGRVRKVTLGSSAAALTLALGGSNPQRLLAQKGITVTATCNTPCSLTANGYVRILGTSTVLGLQRAAAKRAAGTRTLKLRFAVSEQKAFRQLLKPGQRAQAVITVKATDNAGGTRTSKRTVAVVR